MYGVPVRRLRLMHNDHTPRADFIVAEQTSASYKAIWRALVERRISGTFCSWASCRASRDA